MLQDQFRTQAYYDAIYHNKIDFDGKVVVDVGAGSGILSFFAAHNGAKRVFAVEASDMADHLETLVRNSPYANVIKVLKCKVESAKIDEPADVILSEPIGVFLVHERMIESFIFARDKFLKKQSGEVWANQMYPSRGSFKLAPFSDASLYSETLTKVKFWGQTNFYGVNLSSLEKAAMQHFFGQPVVGPVDMKSLFCEPISSALDFCTVTAQQLKDFVIPLEFVAAVTGLVHGIAGWFDLEFMGSCLPQTLSTAPRSPLTHWYQIRFLLKEPLAINFGQKITGAIFMHANQYRSYDIRMEVFYAGKKIENAYRLQDQQYSYLNPSLNADTKAETYNLYCPLNLSDADQ